MGKLFHSKVLRLGGKIWYSRGSWSESPQNHGGWKQKTPRHCSERTEWGSQGKDYSQILVSEVFVMLRVTVQTLLKKSQQFFSGSGSICKEAWSPSSGL